MDNQDQNSWEKHTIQQLLFSNLKEQRTKRKWGVVFKILGFGYVFFITALLIFGNNKITSNKEYKGPHTALIEIEGEISRNQPANADDINQSLKNAFKHKQTKGIILKINSPGGSPVQARQIYNNILRLRKEYKDIKVYAAIEDMGTSAAYLIASAADQIYADETSLVGSIGVIIDSFGFVDALQKLGVERRLYIAGKNKAMLDPFSPRNKEQEEFIGQQLDLVHKIFIKNIVDKRSASIKKLDDQDIFSGKFWVGQSALDLGLIDGFGDCQYIATEIIQAGEIRDFTLQPSLVERLTAKFKLMLKSIIFKLY
ncbi:MAG: S49 family peptidase [Gammaproteobacteria bacterium]